jgi:O-antigen ligase
MREVFRTRIGSLLTAKFNFDYVGRVRWVTLFILSSALAAGLALGGGSTPHQWNWSVLGIAIAGVLYWATLRSRDRAPRDPWTTWLVTAFGAWGVFQLVPLPPWLVAVLSPMRHELSQAAGITGWTSISIAPAQTFSRLLELGGAILTFFLARELCWRWRGKSWIAAAPLIVAGIAEALIGAAQAYVQGANDGPLGVSGTYVNRNHYAALLEMTLPLVLAAAAAVYRAGAVQRARPAAPAIKASALMGCGALMLAALAASQSRMAFLGAVCSLAVMGVISVTAVEQRMYRAAPLGRRILAGGAVFAAVGLLSVLVPPKVLIERYGLLAGKGGEIGDARLGIWRESIPMLKAYPIVGCGLGTYESGFMRFKRVAPMYRVDFAHNDYLQILVEFGVVGFAIGLAVVLRIVGRALRAALFHKERRGWELEVGLAGALTALLIHSGADFNLYIPANAMTLAWICGLAVSPGLRDY